mmetsp:Transcript_12645/g.20436  ORF Transcript_12645/g.20436 Transcript_12645/m.20436 type:complete len:567 (+) Transcript_12645:206-1906(+)
MPGRVGRHRVNSDPKYGSKGRFPLLRKLVLLVLFGILGFSVLVYSGSAAVSQISVNRARDMVNRGVRGAYGGDDSTHFGMVHFGKVVQEPSTGHKSAPAEDLVHTRADGALIGYVRVPKIPEGPRTGDDGKLHIIFSSGCNYFQHWQSELLLATAYLVGQRGRVTRIVSGCYDKTAENVKHEHQTFPAGKNDQLVPIEILNRSVNENFGLFVTPEFEGAIAFPWINKPSSIKYFMENARPELERLGETVIAILDPDFIFLKPLTQVGEKPSDMIISEPVLKDKDLNNPVDVVVKGRPVAQRYGLGGGWVDPKWDLDVITGDHSTPAKKWTREEAQLWTDVGPPLMAHVDDLTPLSVLWEKYMRPVLEIEKEILADMWAYSIASAHLGLKHTIVNHHMISSWPSTQNDKSQAFPWVKEWKEMSCRNPEVKPGYKLPTFIHMASNFKAPDRIEGPWMFHKGHVPATILDCDSPLIIESADDLYEKSLEQNDFKTHYTAWVLCHIVAKLNEVLMLYKQKFCPVGFEQRKLIRLIQSKTKDTYCDEKNDKWCYPLAQIEGLPKGWRKTIQ